MYRAAIRGSDRLIDQRKPATNVGATNRDDQMAFSETTRIVAAAHWKARRIHAGDRKLQSNSIGFDIPAGVPLGWPQFLLHQHRDMRPDHVNQFGGDAD